MRRLGRGAALGGLLAGFLAVTAGQESRAQSIAPPVARSFGDLERVGLAIAAPSAREAIARVAYAEAAGQGDSGLAGVVYTILNRVASGRWGASVDGVVNARAQFEPVLRAGGDWRDLPVASAARRARIDTIINLALDGRLPDLTGGALYFQNPRIVAARAAAGTASTRLVNFGGARPSVTIGDHAFYAEVAGLGGAGRAVGPDPAASAIIVPRDPTVERTGPTGAGGGQRGLFVLSDGSIAEDLP